jgi:NAD(P)H-dependent FMN reductase
VVNAAASILAFAGSTRRDSLNKKLIAVAVAGAREAGGSVTLIDLRDFPLPIYDGDLEASGGLPQAAVELKRLLAEHRGLLISTPEYNGSVPGVLKNVIDWTTRSTRGEASLASYEGKVAALVSASVGSAGGLRAQQHLRQILGTINVTLIPQQWRIALASDASFDESGKLRDASAQNIVRGVGASLVKFLQRFAD